LTTEDDILVRASHLPSWQHQVLLHLATRLSLADARVTYGVYHPNYDNHVYRDVYIGYTNTEPFNRGHDDDSIQYGALTVDGLPVVARVVGVLSRFPTLAGQAGFVVADAIARIAHEARGRDAVLVLEAGRENGDSVSARKGLAGFDLHVAGRSAHAGAEPERGRSSRWSRSVR